MIPGEEMATATLTSRRSLYEDIVEVVETGAGAANLFLKAGYTLLGIYPTARQEKSKGGDQAFYLRKRPAFVLGRTADVAEYTLPKQAAAPAEGPKRSSLEKYV